jgi:hypothetical protein
MAQIEVSDDFLKYHPGSPGAVERGYTCPTAETILVVGAKRRRNRWKSFAIKTSVVTNLLDANSIKYQIEPSQNELSMQNLTQKIKGYTVKIECN